MCNVLSMAIRDLLHETFAPDLKLFPLLGPCFWREVSAII